MKFDKVTVRTADMPESCRDVRVKFEVRSPSHPYRGAFTVGFEKRETAEKFAGERGLTVVEV